MIHLLKERPLQMRGQYFLTAKKKGTEIIVAELKTKNLVVTVGKKLMCRLLLQGVGQVTGHTGLNYQALGTGTTTPSVADTTLQTEVYRKLITSGPDTSTNEATFYTFFTAAQSTYFIKEVGIFGDGATGTANSGVMFSRALLSYDNSGGANDITIAYVVTIG